MPCIPWITEASADGSILLSASLALLMPTVGLCRCASGPRDTYSGLVDIHLGDAVLARARRALRGKVFSTG